MITTRVTDIEKFRDPQSDGWAGVSNNRVVLDKTPLALQPNEYIRTSWKNRTYGETDHLDFASVHDGKEIAFRLEWRNPIQHQRDAVAIAIPISGEPPLVTMGMQDAPMHILHWVGREKNVRSTIAAGIGTSRAGGNVGQSGVVHWQDGVRQAVLTRRLGQVKEAAPLEPGMETLFAIALWRGANDERAGIKAYSITWNDLQLGA